MVLQLVLEIQIWSYSEVYAAAPSSKERLETHASGLPVQPWQSEGTHGDLGDV